MSNTTLIQSYVHHKGKCFFVSTIDRDSSAAAYQGLYAETIVWEWNKETRERGEMIGQDEGGQGSIYEHARICRDLFKNGTLDEVEE